MAITTLDGAIAGMQYTREIIKGLTGTMVAGRPHSLWLTAGIPSIAPTCSAGLTGEVLTNSAVGSIPFSNPNPTTSNTYLARLVASATIAGQLVLCDRLWQNSVTSLTSTGEQTFTDSVQIPARDANGTNSGHGVFAGAEVQVATGAGTPTLTLKYTNESGNANITTSNIVATVATSIVGTFYPFGLADGDQGIQKAQSLKLSATWTSGVASVVLYRVIARLDLLSALAPSSIDLLTSGFQRIYHNSSLFLMFIPSTTTTSQIQGNVTWTQG